MMEQGRRKREIPVWTNAVLCLLLTILLVHPGPAQERRGHPDSTVAPLNTNIPPDSTLAHRPDSLVRWDLHTWAGSLALITDTTQSLTAGQLEWLAPVSLGHAIQRFPGVYLFDPSSIGQYQHLTIRGVDWRGISFTIDGIPAADPSTGMLNLSVIPVSIADRVEVITGPRAFLYNIGAVGGAVNIVTRRASHTIPSTTIRYAESGYEYACSDGSANQDISRRVNVALGYQYQGTEGRFDNSGHEQWSFRSSVRYHAGQQWDVTLSHLYTQTQTGLNGGINLDLTGVALAFLPQQAIVQNTDAYEKLTRHDLALKIAGSFFGDSTNLTSISLYSSHMLREYRDEENRLEPNGIFLQHNHRVTWSGLQMRQRFHAGAQNFTGGFHVEERRIQESPTMGSRRNPMVSGWLLDEIAVTSGIVWSVFGRLDHFRGTTHSGFGTDLTIRLNDVVSVMGGFSHSTRPVTYAEAFWSDTTVFRSQPLEEERHTQGEIGTRLAFGKDGSARATYVFRRIKNPVLFSALFFATTGLRPAVLLSQGDQHQTHSVELSLNLHIGFVLIEGTAAYILQTDGSGTEVNELPRTRVRGGIYFRDRLLDGALELQAGVRGDMRSSFRGSTLSGESLFPLPNTRVTVGMASTLDLVLIARIGDAYIHFLWENLANTSYFSTPFTPALDRSIRFGVSWEFKN